MSQDSNDGLVARLGRIDRRWIFLAMALAIIVPILMRLRFEEEPQRMAQATFDTIEALPAGSVATAGSCSSSGWRSGS